MVEFRTKDLTEADLKDGALTLTLTQDLAGFSADGPLKFYLGAWPRSTRGPRSSTLATIDGLGGQVATKDLIGRGRLQEEGIRQGRRVPPSSFSTGPPWSILKGPRDERTSRSEIAVVVPDDETVAATFLGGGSNDVSKRPKLLRGAAPLSRRTRQSVADAPTGPADVSARPRYLGCLKLIGIISEQMIPANQQAATPGGTSSTQLGSPLAHPAEDLARIDR